jgi:hypothetical protein
MSNQEVENEALVGGSVSNVGLGIADATHYLHCTHCIGRSTKHYKMRCVVLKEMTNDRLKLLVFGYGSGHRHKTYSTERSFRKCLSPFLNHLAGGESPAPFGCVLLSLLSKVCQRNFQRSNGSVGIGIL